MGRCVIVGGAKIEDYEWVRSHLSKDDFFIFCDGGLNHLEFLGVEPRLIVGDFDSFDKPDTEIETICLPCEKDDTDTMFAVKEALKRGFDRILLIGVVGQRLDHTLGNLSALLYIESAGGKGKIVDDFSEMEIVSNEPVLVNPDCSYFSLINLDGSADKITIEDAKYPLCDATITTEYQYGISNQCLPETTAKIALKNGRLLLIKVR